MKHRMLIYCSIFGIGVGIVFGAVGVTHSAVAYTSHVLVHPQGWFVIACITIYAVFTSLGTLGILMSHIARRLDAMDIVGMAGELAQIRRCLAVATSPNVVDLELMRDLRTLGRRLQEDPQN